MRILRFWRGLFKRLLSLFFFFLNLLVLDNFHITNFLRWHQVFDFHVLFFTWGNVRCRFLSTWYLALTIFRALFLSWTPLTFINFKLLYFFNFSLLNLSYFTNTIGWSFLRWHILEFRLMLSDQKLIFDYSVCKIANHVRHLVNIIIIDNWLWGSARRSHLENIWNISEVTCSTAFCRAVRLSDLLFCKRHLTSLFRV